MGRVAHAAARRRRHPACVNLLNISLLAGSLLLVAAMVSVLLGGLVAPAKRD
jgi:hypothetical protein